MVIFTSVLSGKRVRGEAVERFTTLKCVSRIPVQIPLSKHFSFCRELRHLTPLIERVAGGTVACLCDISIYLLF